MELRLSARPAASLVKLQPDVSRKLPAENAGWVTRQKVGEAGEGSQLTVRFTHDESAER